MADRDTILVAYDGSDDARAAIGVAGSLLRPRRAVVLHVWESLARVLLHSDVSALTGPMKEAAEELDAEDAERARTLAGQGAGLAREAGLDASPLAAQGKPNAWPTILQEADRVDAACVVVGSRGVSGIKAALLGSVSSGVLHHSRRPVLVVKPDPPGDGGPVILGYDRSDAAKRAIEVAGALIAGGPALVATCWTSCRDAGSAAVLGVPAYVASGAAERLDAEAGRGAQDVAEEGAELARAAGFEAKAIAERSSGNAWSTLARLGYEHLARAFVVGSRGRSALASALLGSVSSGLAHHAPAPVLVVPPAGD